MKRKLLVSALVVLLTVGTVWAAISGSISRQNTTAAMYHASVSLSGLTSAEIVAASSGKQIQVLAIVVSSDTATTVTLKSGSNVILPLVMGASGGLFEQSSNMELPLIATDGTGSLNVTLSSAPTTAGIYVIYRYR